MLKNTTEHVCDCSALVRGLPCTVVLRTFECVLTDPWVRASFSVGWSIKNWMSGATGSRSEWVE